MAALTEALLDPIQGERFIEIADSCYCPEKGDMYLEQNENVRGNVIYTHTHFVSSLFQKLNELKLREASIVVISHNSDAATPEIRIPGCVRKWFSQNVSYDEDRIQSIPIGLENNRWFPELRKREKMLAQLGKRRKLRKVLYINHNVETNQNERGQIYDQYKGVRYAKIDYGRNGQNFDSYLRNIYNHKFVFCPNGNGIDTHRLWETLYMGSIPIVKHSTNITYYLNLLPVLSDRNMRHPVAKNDLEGIYSDFKKREWRYDALKFSYWKELIHHMAQER